MHPVWGLQESMEISAGAIIRRSLPGQTITASPELLEAIVSISIRPAINGKTNGDAPPDSRRSSVEDMVFERWVLRGQEPLASPRWPGQ